MEDKNGNLIGEGVSILRNSNRATDSRYVVIPFITDTHYDSASVDTGTALDYNAIGTGPCTAKYDTSLSIEHVRNVADFASRFNVDAIIHGGDIIDGKQPRATSVSNLKEVAEILSSTGLPVSLAKGNHDDNCIYGKKWAPSAKKDMKYTIKGNVLDPIFRADKSNKVVYDTGYLNSTNTFNTNFEDYMDPEEYRVMHKLMFGDPSTGSFKMSAANLDVLSSMSKSLSLTSAQTTALNSFLAQTTPTLSGQTATNKTILTKLFYDAAVARTRGSHNYIDFPNQQVRVITLNSYDTPYETDANGYNKYDLTDFGGYGRAQVKWFAEKALKTNYKVVVFSHVAITGAPFTRDGGSSGDTFWFGNNELIKVILDMFINGEKGTVSTLGAIQKLSATGVNIKDAVNGYTPLQAYNNVANKKAISEHSYMKVTNLNVDFSAQGKGTVITTVSGHSHIAKMGLEVFGKYQAAMANCSLRESKIFPDNSGVDGNFTDSKGVYHTKPMLRKHQTYKEDAWEVMVIDTLENKVLFYQFGAGMIDETIAAQSTAESNPGGLTPSTGMFPVRRLGYGSNVSLARKNGLQSGLSKQEGK